MKRYILQKIGDIGMMILEETIGTPEFDAMAKYMLQYNAWCQIMLGIELK